MFELRFCPQLPVHLVRNSTVLPHRDYILPLLPKGKVIVEIGVARGDFSQMFLDICQPKLFIAIDIFTCHLLDTVWGKPTLELFEGKTHVEYYKKRFSIPIQQGNMRIMHDDSASALEELDDNSIDIFYVDANHLYEFVQRELSIIKRKISADGYIIMNDYIMNEVGASNVPYGVIQATNEFMIKENWEMTHFALQHYMYCDVVLRPVGVAQSMRDRVDALEQEKEALRRDVALLRKSTSWKITAPIRALRGGGAVR